MPSRDGADVMVGGLAPRRLRRLRQAVLAWYREVARELPWRGTHDPYRVWVAEVMLQQTTVKAVAPYYLRFLERFPDLPTLATASSDEVLARWSGLGYYQRARNLHRAASVLTARHEGRFPDTLSEALALPGVGAYTARAVLSIAHAQPWPVVDGNVRRVLARLLALSGPAWRRDTDFYPLADRLLDRTSPGEWNQALMELGATLCRPRAPGCPRCPLKRLCVAHASGREEAYPQRSPRRPTEHVTIAAALVERRGRVLLVRRREGRLLGRLWEIPQTGLESSGLVDLVPELRLRHGLHVVPGELAATVRHAITFRRIRAEAYRTHLAQPAPRSQAHLWARRHELPSLPLSSLTVKLLRGAALPSGG